MLRGLLSAISGHQIFVSPQRLNKVADVVTLTNAWEGGARVFLDSGAGMEGLPWPRGKSPLWSRAGAPQADGGLVSCVASHQCREY